MIIEIKDLLPQEVLQNCRKLLKEAEWVDGKKTAGFQAIKVKNNEQISETAPQLPELQKIITQHLSKNNLFFSAALPKRIIPPYFNRYSGETNSYGNHVDNSIRTLKPTGQNIRTDISCTVFLSDPNEYEGGELVVEDTFGSSKIKLKAGNAILYPSTSLHRVNPTTKGERVASFFWVESMVKSNDHRKILFDMDVAISNLRTAVGDTPHILSLSSSYHNLLRIWAET
jgi:PKHD-type hydroxylase